jgi:general stress protein 26
MSAPNREDLLAFLKSRFLGTIATVGTNSKPEAAYVAYSCNEKLELIVGTSNKSRKFKNISKNKFIAFVIADTTGEVQYEGKVKIISLDDYEIQVAEHGFKHLDGYDYYRTDPAQVYLKITPKWIRFILHFEANKIAEFTEFA